MQILTTWLRPSSGKVTWNDEDIFDKTQNYRMKLGYLPENNPLYEDMMVYDYLMSMASQRGIPRRERGDALRRIVSKCGISGIMHRNINQLSKGLRQRVGLAQAIIHDPEFLILDEATTGLDPNQIIEIRELIRDIGREKTVLLSTHVLQEVTAICDRILVLCQGRIVADGSLDDICTKETGLVTYSVQLCAPISEDLVNYIRTLDKKFTPTETSAVTFVPDNPLDERKTMQALAAFDCVAGFCKNKPTIEQVFKHLTTPNL